MSGKSPKNRGLGRGLDALFADQAPIDPGRNNENTAEGLDENSIIYVDINDIIPNRNQPRKTFDPEKITELSDSIREHGIIQPLVVRHSDSHYEIVAGERRWRAAREADLDTVPCIIREFTDEENMLVAIIENMQREDLNPIEEAMGLNEMIKAYGLTQEEVSKSVSKSRPYITNSLRLLKLPEEIRDHVRAGRLTTGHARALLGVKSEARQKEICDRIIREGISVREAEKLAAGVKPRKKTPAKRVKSPDTVSVENELKEIYGTRVSINQKGKKGTIELEFYSREELNRLIDILKSVE
ncbi:ParB/RepB/Spo0J family partition protein [Hornefia butyriciproducens]|uniref:ParB/RepB/Spo0J family partition protein n=1 Tax=Hornefia butyriciproducens TaxID=2652293 RepID=UPI002A753375|nr:ParB/RepB/Spo0J family partition protein [Hornefia butyriciproducens]MDY2991486.1 ParB/RepB/Spo0J family partition protein [Hornefia butyriciproducens]